MTTTIEKIRDPAFGDNEATLDERDELRQIKAAAESWLADNCSSPHIVREVLAGRGPIRPTATGYHYVGEDK